MQPLRSAMDEDSLSSPTPNDFRTLVPEIHETEQDENASEKTSLGIQIIGGSTGLTSTPLYTPSDWTNKGDDKDTEDRGPNVEDNAQVGGIEESVPEESVFASITAPTLDPLNVPLPDSDSDSEPEGNADSSFWSPSHGNSSQSSTFILTDLSNLAAPDPTSKDSVDDTFNNSDGDNEEHSCQPQGGLHSPTDNPPTPETVTRIGSHDNQKVLQAEEVEVSKAILHDSEKTATNFTSQEASQAAQYNSKAAVLMGFERWIGSKKGLEASQWARPSDENEEFKPTMSPNSVSNQEHAPEPKPPRSEASMCARKSGEPEPKPPGIKSHGSQTPSHRLKSHHGRLDALDSQRGGRHNRKEETRPLPALLQRMTDDEPRQRSNSARMKQPGRIKRGKQEGDNGERDYNGSEGANRGKGSGSGKGGQRQNGFGGGRRGGYKGS